MRRNVTEHPARVPSGAVICSIGLPPLEKSPQESLSEPVLKSLERRGYNPTTWADYPMIP